MKRFLIYPALFLLPSCGLVSSIQSGIQETRQIVAENKDNVAQIVSAGKSIMETAKALVDQLKPLFAQLDVKSIADLVAKVAAMKDELASSMAELKAANQQAFAAADKNSNGKLDTSGEWLAYLLAGGSAAATALLSILSKLKNGTMQAQTDEHYDAIADLKKQLAVLQAQQPKA